VFPELLFRDLLTALRGAVRRPGFTLLVTLTLALGIGVNSAVFALLDAVLLRPLPYRDPSRIVYVWQTMPSQNVMELEPTPFDYDAWHALHGLSALGMMRGDTFTLTGDDNPERVNGARVTSSLMPLLGISPRLGRNFTAAEDRDGTTNVAILSDRLWRRRFGADDHVLGRIVQVNGESRTIVGVMPRGAALSGPLAGDDDLWLPAQMPPDERTNEVSHNYRVLARLADGVTLEQASREIEAFAARLKQERPSHGVMGAALVPIPEETVHLVKPTLLLIAASVALLLLVASANASTLLLARAANRQHEVAVRTALGATRGRLISLAVSESLVFAAFGGFTGLVLGGWALRVVLPLFSAALPPAIPIEIGSRVAIFTAAISTILGVLFGLVVAAQQSGLRLGDTLKASGRAIAGRAGRMRGALVAAQVALAVVLLSAAGLMVTSVVRLSRVQPGFDPSHLLTFKIALTGANYAAAPARVAFASTLIERLEAAPGVRHAAVSSAIPFGGARAGNAFTIEGRPRKAGELQIADQRYVSTGYFKTMNIPLLEGRLFEGSDDGRGELVVIVNRTMAKRFWPNESPIDRRIRTGLDPAIWFRIVGVVDDVRHISLTRDAVTEMYRPIAQTAAAVFTLVVRTDGEPASFSPTARAAVQAIDRDLPMYDVRTMDERIASSFAQARGTMLLLAVTAMLAAGLSGVAIYGSIWYSITQRLPEIGIRLALGATRASIVMDVLARALGLTAIGLTAGLVIALAAGRLLGPLLFDTRTTDPATYVAVAAATIALALAAGAIPARRATLVDPLTVLRES
jgi:putative ABC transport system permease protein